MIALYKGTSPFSRMIRWFNFGRFSHVSWIDDRDGVEFEAWSKGVAPASALGSNHTSGTTVLLLDDFLTNGEADGMREFFAMEEGSPYDWRGIFGFVARRRVENPDAWFCSEIVAAARISVKKPLLQRVEPFRTYPDLLSYSPLLKFNRLVTTGKEIAHEDSHCFVDRARALGCL